MASFLTRRLLNPKSISIFLKSPISLKPSFSNSIPTFHPKPFHSQISYPFFLPYRNLCSNLKPPQQQDQENQEKQENQENQEEQERKQFKHQEIEGPTVDRDLSPLANETREILDKTRRSIYSLSNSLALLGATQLFIGGWIIYYTPHGLPHEVPLQGIVSFAFPFAAAFVMRRSLKPMGFFKKMEEIGRLRILTLALQQVKGIELLLRRTETLVLFCSVGLSVGFLACEFI